MADFSCANLDGADFGHHALFPGIIDAVREYSVVVKDKPGWYDKVTPPTVEEARENSSRSVKFSAVLISPPKFYKAILSNTNLENVEFFSIGSESSRIYSSWVESKLSEFHLREGVIKDSVFIDHERASINLEINPFLQGITTADVPDSRQYYDMMRSWLVASMYMAQVSNAKLSPGIKGMLQAIDEKDARAIFKSIFASDNRGQMDQDENCTPVKD